MFADYESSGDDSKAKDEILPERGPLKIAKADLEVVPRPQVGTGATIKQVYRDVPTVGLQSSLSKRKPDASSLNKNKYGDSDDDLDERRDTVAKTHITPEEDEMAKKKFVPAVLKTKKPSKPIEI